MAKTSIFARTPPKFGINDEWVTFDAVINDTLEFSVDYTQFPIEIGADATDHGIIRPSTQVMTIAVSNNPLSTNLIQFAPGFVSNFIDSGVASLTAGLASGFLGNAEESRAKSVLEFFVSLMYSRTPFDVDSVDYISKNMVITKLRRTRDIETEGGLVLAVEMQELPLLYTVISANQRDISTLNSGDVSQTQAAADQNKGEVIGLPVSSRAQDTIAGLI